MAYINNINDSIVTLSHAERWITHFLAESKEVYAKTDNSILGDLFLASYSPVHGGLLKVEPETATIPQNAGTVFGVLAFDDKNLYWPAIPGQTGFIVAKLVRPEVLPLILALALDGPSSTPFNYDPPSQLFILNQFFHGASAKGLFGGIEAYYIKNAVSVYLQLVTVWPALHFNPRIDISSPVYDKLMDEMPWFAATLASGSRDDVDIASPLYRSNVQDTSSYLRNKFLDSYYAPSITGLTNFAPLSRFLEACQLPLDDKGQLKDNASELSLSQKNLIRQSGAPVASQLGSFSSYSTEESAKLTEFYAALGEMVTIWKRILKKEKGISKVAKLYPMQAMAAGAVHRRVIIPFAKSKNSSKTHFKGTQKELEAMIEQYLKKVGVRTNKKKLRNQEFRGDLSKSVYKDHQKRIEEGQNTPMALFHERADILTSLQRDEGDTIHRAITFVIPKNLIKFASDRMKTFLGKVIVRNPADYDDYALFFHLVMFYLFSQYLAPYGGTQAKKADLDIGVLPSRFHEDIGKIIALYVEDLMSVTTVNMKPWKIEQAEKTKLLAVLKEF